jgi:CrcB protein
MLRYGFSRAFGNPAGVSFPWATFLVNFSGSLVIGLVWGISLRSAIPGTWKLFLMTGICGGFTTFSAFSLESVRLIQENKTPVFLLYAAASIILCLLATYAGIRIAGQ